MLNPTSGLFQAYVNVPPGVSALLLHSNDPSLARWLAEEVGAEGRVTALHTSHRALALLSNVSDLVSSDAVYPSANTHGPADLALLVIPKGRDLTRAYLWTTARTLKPGGQLYLAGPNARGAKSAIKDAAELFGDAPVLGYKSSRRIAVATRPDSVAVPASWGRNHPWQPQMRMAARPDGLYQLVTQPGVFSWEHLDEGTALLLDHLDIVPDSDVLDVGCGYGIIGLVAARAGARVTLVDDNLLAVRCTRSSVALNGLDGRCTVLPSDVLSAVRDCEFDLVLSNPPFHQDVDVSTAVAERIVQEAFGVLRPGGHLRLVANRFLPYDRPMNATFGNVTTVAETKSYRVLDSTREGG